MTKLSYKSIKFKVRESQTLKYLIMTLHIFIQIYIQNMDFQFHANNEKIKEIKIV